MLEQQFNENVMRRTDMYKQTLVSKSSEYSTDTDRLANFKQIATMFGDKYHSLEILLILQAKHTQSLLLLVDKVIAGEQVPQSIIDEKLGDHLNYDLLLENLLYDSMNENQDKDDNEN